MIQRFSVHFEDSGQLDAAIAGLTSMGFAEGSIRIWREEITGDISLYAYRDEAVDQMPPLDPQKMEEYCAALWTRIGTARLTLTDFQQTSAPLEFGREEHAKWSAG
jgi:hypothetical protein